MISGSQPACREAPILVAVPPRFHGLRMCMLWMNILGLDAPLVALVWQDFFAWNLGVKLSAAPRVVLGLSVWLAYAADRWLDGWRIPKDAKLIAARHRFAQRQRVPLAFVWLFVLAGAVMLSRFYLPAAMFQRGLWLVAGVWAYLFLNQCPGTKRWLRGLKEIAVGILFAAGTMIFILPDAPRFSGAVWRAVAGWCLLCFLNCYAIACWEREQDEAENQESLVTRWPALAGVFKGAAFLLVIYALTPMLARHAADPPRIGLAVAASSVALAVLDYWSASMETSLLRVSADLVLLTPLLFRFLP